MAQQLRSFFSLLQRTWSLFPGPTWWLTNIYNPTFREGDALFLKNTIYLVHRYTCKQNQETHKIIRLKKKRNEHIETWLHFLWSFQFGGSGGGGIDNQLADYIYKCHDYKLLKVLWKERGQFFRSWGQGIQPSLCRGRESFFLTVNKESGSEHTVRIWCKERGK